MRQHSNLAEVKNGELVPRPEYELVPDIFQEESLDLRKYWSIVRGHVWSILGLALSIALLTYLFMLTKQPIYQATSTLIIEPKAAQRILSIQDMSGVEGGNGAEYFNTQIEILKSRALARRVVDGLPLPLQKQLGGEVDHKDLVESEDDDNEKQADQIEPLIAWPDWLTDLFKPPEAPQTLDLPPTDIQETRAGAFLGGLSISPVRGTQIVQITYESTDPVMAMQAANLLCKTYIDTQSQSRSQTSKESSQWLSDRVEKLRAELAASQQRLNDYMESQDLINLGGGKQQGGGVMTLSADELASLQTRFTEARNKRMELETLFSQLAGSKSVMPQNLESFAAIANDPAIAALKAKENEAVAQLKQIAGRYGVQHPERQAAEAALASVRSALQRQLTTAISGLGSQVETARANEAALARMVEQSKGKVQDISRKDSKLSQLSGEVETNRNLYEMFYNRLKETTETQDLSRDNSRILDLAQLPTKPVKPNAKKSALIAGLLALMAGIGLAFLLDQLDTSLKSAEEVEEKLGLPFIGMVPYIKGGANPEGVPGYDEDSLSTFSEAIRSIRTGVIFSTLSTPNPVISITSSMEGEGKTTLVMNLALALAQLRRVLIIETDLRRPQMAKRLQLPARSPGLTNYLLQEVDLKRCVHHVEPNLDLITAGKIPPNPLEILSSPQFSSLLEELRERYEMILLDAPPEGPVSDPLVLSQVSDAMIIVVKAQKTPVRTVRHATSALQRVGAPLIGVVLNAGEKSREKYYHYYHDSYGEYRSEDASA